MRVLTLIICYLILPIFLNGCSHVDEQQDATLLIPLPPNPIDPTDAQARKAITSLLRSSNAPAATRYDLQRYDLNGDGRREALVFLKAPYRYWCGTHGCTVLVFKAHNEHFSLVNDIQPIRAPLYISPNKSEGWHDLIARVSGRWSESRDVALRFDGQRYPQNPEAAPNDPYYAFYTAQKTGVRLFYE